MQHLNIKAGGFLTKVNHTAAQVTYFVIQTPAFQSRVRFPACREEGLEYGFTTGVTVAAFSALRTGKPLGFYSNDQVLLRVQIQVFISQIKKLLAKLVCINLWSLRGTELNLIYKKSIHNYA